MTLAAVIHAQFRPWQYRGRKVAAWPLAGALIGCIAWGNAGGLPSLLTLVLLPMAWGYTSYRSAAWLLMVGYFLAGARGLPAGAVVFFGDVAPSWFGWCLWAVVALLQSAPFAAAWSAAKTRRAAGFVVACVVSALPPLAIVGWVNPVTIAGAVFPGLGWFGMGITLGLFLALGLRAWRGTAALAAAAVIANAWHQGSQRPAPDLWMGFDTSFPRMSSAGADDASQLLAALTRIKWLKTVIRDMPAGSTLVLPETIIGRYDGLAQFELSESDDQLRAKRSRVLVGAEIPVEGSASYYNAVVVLGSRAEDSRFALQSIPVPISMWKPWADDGAIADMGGKNSTITVSGQRAGVAVCYEQLLTYSMLRLAFDSPSVIVGVSNVWWARETNIPQIQEQSAKAFGRLFNVPVVLARNL